MSNPILPRAPLILVLAEVNFSPILSLSKKIADIQEELRRVGFPEFWIANKEPDPELPQSEPEYLWKFGAKKNQTAIVISNDTLTLETSEYIEFNDFIKSFERVLNVFAKIAHPDLLKSIDLRYIDLIQDIDGKKSDDLIAPKFIQLEHIGVSQNHYQYESVQFETAEGIVRVNLIKSFDEAIVPPDIKPVVLIPVEKTDEDIILDIDHIVIFEETDFSIAKIIETFQRIHDQDVMPAFESIVTPLAIQLWGKEGRS